MMLIGEKDNLILWIFFLICMNLNYFKYLLYVVRIMYRVVMYCIKYLLLNGFMFVLIGKFGWNFL